jgi:hypothetical protein
VRALSDIEVSRALHALVVTLNDQRATGADRARWQEIVTGALGGEQLIAVAVDAHGDCPAGRLHAPDGRTVAVFARRGDRWTGRREGSPLSGGYIPR